MIFWFLLVFRISVVLLNSPVYSLLVCWILFRLFFWLLDWLLDSRLLILQGTPLIQSSCLLVLLSILWVILDSLDPFFWFSVLRPYLLGMYFLYSL
ncbi:hypothetical protein H8356DRAFT_1642981 [Neocallimastix lanati (nom. inval.)]|nr:hypothetical protein H8356DRAFT_1758831 [Neocallimastix sp. JGI-2020a]KAG4081594.1 hypothetical protein H8356DRAFT_1758663 [Neocallimastix sp. JGI-2020a]KAG4081595.1 hypothetical protein H8356DRAFT_1758664 [Neocallimastix sp. JGI-2020a]KAG4081596.1 hypothetical protein H8356DRAFT_1758665 [Neocallimastix sp. JGI-2020a]KAG4081616.1 hypothetical protein H8356DRAFT_1758343 [Neocallimastix sp. JGI-2020a]